jgi:hypothetical protein
MNDLAQVMDALARANTVRAAQVAFRRTMRELSPADGRDRAASLLIGDEDLDDDVSRMQVARFLSTVRRFGPTNLEHSLKAAGILSGQRQVCDLTNRQRVALAFALSPAVARGDVEQAA